MTAPDARRRRIRALERLRIRVDDELAQLRRAEARHANTVLTLGGPRPRSSGAGPGRPIGLPRGEAAKVRAWALTHGYTIAARGPIPAIVITAYRKAHP